MNKEDLVGIDIRFDKALRNVIHIQGGGPADLAFPRNHLNSHIVQNLLISMTFLGWCLVMHSNLIVRLTVVSEVL